MSKKINIIIWYVLTATDKEKLSRVTAEPTTTRHVLPFKITHDPKLYMYDTPGIMLPRSVDIFLPIDFVGFDLVSHLDSGIRK